MNDELRMDKGETKGEGALYVILIHSDFCKRNNIVILIGRSYLDVNLIVLSFTQTECKYRLTQFSHY